MRILCGVSFFAVKMSSVPQWFYIIIVTIVYFGYIFLGGLVFMWLEKPREDQICDEIKMQMQRVRNLNAEAERLKNEGQGALSQAQNISTVCAEGDTSDACVQLMLRKRRHLEQHFEKSYHYFENAENFWDAKAICRQHNMELTNGMVQYFVFIFRKKKASLNYQTTQTFHQTALSR